LHLLAVVSLVGGDSEPRSRCIEQRLGCLTVMHPAAGDHEGQRPALAVDPGVDTRVKNGPALAGHGAEAVRDSITSKIINLPEQLPRSLTWDQGAEMSQHARLKIGTGLDVYFCDPHSPWQRGLPL
jgi:IS30 family transposase